MSEIKSLIDYDIIENIDHSAICVKFAMMSKQIENKDKEIERLKEELEYTIPIVEYNKTITKHLKKIERLNNIIDKVYEYLDEKKDVPEWWDTDFMICMDMLKGGDGNLSRIFEEENKGYYELGSE